MTDTLIFISAVTASISFISTICCFNLRRSRCLTITSPCLTITRDVMDAEELEADQLETQKSYDMIRRKSKDYRPSIEFHNDIV